eukprot:CAMPEP_0174829324 /NCGR_PEP_ID=MMETSP1114-20130205/1870_1 /TAXON_ID=312471 /ORGANISM="Neobodo designis, Strain CCAP 1951/1" /LENGTH=576 /DNA_ID=CAMNT_0016063067 /DNA_START=26 /DNA_END=1756 /DNA_ORIENTATION=+
MLGAKILAVVVVVVALTFLGADAHTSSAPPPRFWQDTKYHASLENHRRNRIRRMQTHVAPTVAALRLAEPTAACDKCKIATAIVVDVLMNVSSLNETQPLVNAACKAAFANDTDKRAICEVVADVAIDLGHHMFDEIVGHLHFNIPVLLCSDILKLCDEPCCTQSTRPEQVRIAFATSQTIFADGNGAYTVTWTSLLGTTPWQLRWRMAGGTWVIPAEAPSMQTSSLGGWQGFVFSQRMTGLAAATTYEYGVFDSTSGAIAAGPFNTTTLPTNAGTPQRPLRVLALADMGIVNAAATMQRMTHLARSGAIDFVLHYGDMGYADGDEPVWDAFLRDLEPIASKVPYMTTPGNHECFWNFTYYRMRMPMPAAGDGAPADAMWYGLDVNGVAISMMDTESFIDTPEWTPVQHAWLSRRLRSTNAAKKFNIVAHHRPLYCTRPHGDAKDCTTYSVYLRGLMEPLYDAMRVPFVTVGHLHNYERTFPVKHDERMSTNYTNVTATTYLVNGAPGNKEGQAVFPEHGAAPWSAFRSDAVGFSVMSIAATAGQTATLASEFVRSSDGAVLDSFTIETDLSTLPS